jgi:hypothetical protein
MASKTVKDKILDFIEWEFDVEITDKIEEIAAVLVKAITAAKISETPVTISDEDDDFWSTAYPQVESESLFDSLEEDDLGEEDDD